MSSTPVELPALSGQQAQAWATLMSVAGSLGEGWTLIGGQMQGSPRTPTRSGIAPAGE